MRLQRPQAAQIGFAPVAPTARTGGSDERGYALRLGRRGPIGTLVLSMSPAEA
jgi:hypothetical protein